MIDALSTQRNRIRTLILLVICGSSVVAAAFVGIDDNPPGILLAFLAAIAFVLAFVHPWRTSRQFVRLLYISVAGFIVSAILHNIFEAVAAKLGDSGLLPDLLSVAGGAFFFIAVLICPSAVLVAVVGTLIMFLRNHPRHTPGPTTVS